MASVSVAFRTSDDVKAYLTGLGALSKVMKSLVESLKAGDITYDQDRFTGKVEVREVEKEVIREIVKEVPVNNGAVVHDDVDLSQLYDIAAKRRVTPQSLLENALRPYRP